ncbi:phage antirepressor [Exiguobacterium oxidotolerans]|uniref:phage antirepressor n=1 Tax=Exiguobacterium oxidotolerans TaxID=223958 RepID=UPI000494A334|nr:phage antirepressor KilAC domain-containing protein [Exiguobacterium oxidotolerans]
MNQLTKVFEGNEVRVVGTPEQPLFVLADVCKALKLSNPSEVAKRVREKYRSKNNLGRQGNAVTVNEAGLYQVIMRADQSPVAERFQDWVYEEVLPSIRKDGGYMIARHDESPEEIMARGLLIAQTTIERLQHEKEVAATQLEAQRPKVLFADAVSTSQTSILVGQLAKLISQNGVSIGQSRLFAWMRENGYLGKKNAHYNEPTQYSVDRGWFEVTERTVQNPDGTVRITRTTKVTGKGQIYFMSKLLDEVS